MTVISIILKILATVFIIWAIFFSGYLTVSSSDGASVSWRPAPSVFGIMWSIITVILIWIVWSMNIPVDHAMAQSTNVTVIWWLLFFAYVSSCAWWIYAYDKLKKDGIAPLIVCIMTSLMLCLVAYSDNRTSIYAVGLIVPFVWSCIALMMNIEEVRNDS
jgi:hypothetical protein